jgi:radical SAM superfamily enzyme YgiQ (UPF0313 family)
MKLTIIYPAVGKAPDGKYLRAWQMQPLPSAQIAALTPDDVEVVFYDDRMEAIPFDEPTDAVAMGIETYTAKRTYQIASEYRRRNIPVILGGFHATLCPDEVAEYADALLVGEAESVWPRLIDDLKNGNLQKRYQGQACDFSTNHQADRSIFAGRDYVPINLIEAGRGCRFHCEFCSIHNFFQGSHHYRSIDSVVDEIKSMPASKRLLFFVDDNIVSDQKHAIALFNALIPLKIKWVGQADITISQNPELLKLMVKSGCQGVLIGFESLNDDNLRLMKKKMLNSVQQIEAAVRTIHKAGLRIYATFLFGYDNDDPNDFDTILKFCIRNKIFMVGFNNLTPFPGTALYERLRTEGRLLYDKWWLDPDYTYGQIPFRSKVDYETIETECRRVRRKFYGIPSILYRMTNWTNINSMIMLPFYFSINLLLRKDTMQRMKFPLGDPADQKPLLKVKTDA